MTWLTARKPLEPGVLPARHRRALFLMSGLGMGGAELHTLTLRAGLEAAGWETVLVGHGRRYSEVLAAHENAQGAIRLEARGMSSLSGWLKLWNTLHAARADLIITVNQTPLVVASVAKLLGATRAPLACIYHTTILRPGDEKTQGLFARALRRADALIYVSARQARYWRERGLICRTEAVICNGIDLEHYRPDPVLRKQTRAALGIVDSAVVVGVVASLWAEKNHGQLITALPGLIASGRDAHLLLVGDGPLRDTLVGQAASLGLSDRLHLAGEVRDVRPFLNAFDVGALVSTAVETFSLGALEALACGVPMVMSDIGGAREIVTDEENGLLVPPGDGKALENALHRVCDEGFRQTLARAARPSAERHDRTSMLKAYCTLFDRLVPPYAKP